MTECTTRLFAAKLSGHDRSLFHFYPGLHVYSKGVMGIGPEETFAVVVRDLRDGESSTYWGWWDLRHGHGWCHVYPKKFLVEMCFPYGTEVEEENGKGQMANVAVDMLPPAEYCARCSSPREGETNKNCKEHQWVLVGSE